MGAATADAADQEAGMLTDVEWAAKWWRLVHWQAVCNSQLGRNLAVAGALCAAWRDGWNQCANLPFVESRAWRPGCGRGVPR